MGGHHGQEAVVAFISNIFSDKHEVFRSNWDINRDRVAWNRLVCSANLRLTLLHGLAWDLAFVFSLEIAVEELELNYWF